MQRLSLLAFQLYRLASNHRATLLSRGDDDVMTDWVVQL